MLSSNALVELPSEIGLLDNLVSFSCASNAIAGTFPFQRTFFSRASTIQTLDLSENLFAGKIAVDFAFADTLVNLHLRDNQFTGSIPSEIGLLTRLNKLELDTNLLIGSVPTELRELSLLNVATFHNNGFTTGLFTAFCEQNMDRFTADCTSSPVACSCCTECF